VLLGAVVGTALLAPGRLPAQQRPDTLPASLRPFVTVDADVVALRHVRLVDGTGAPARDDQTLVLRDGRIAAVGDEGTVAVPAGARELDLTGRTVLPGLVMVHEHLFYPVGRRHYGDFTQTYPRLYLAGGVTSMRTGGNMNGYVELNAARAVNAWREPGPWIDATGPYVTGAGFDLAQFTTVADSAEAARHVAYWADAGSTSFKAYMHISRGALGAAVREAHARGLRITGHLCSVTYREAAALGIDNLEHGFFVATDFVPDKAPDACRQLPQAEQAAAIDTANPAMRALIADLVARGVAVTSTLAIFETFVPGRPLPEGLELLQPALREAYVRRHSALAGRTSPYGALFRAGMAAEVAFVRAGGLLVAGTDPTGGGGLVPGYSNHRALELLVEAGFTPLEAIRIGTLNGAVYLRRDDRTGSIAVGKQADLLVVDGDPSRTIADVRRVHLVFREGIGFDPARLRESVRGRVGAR
jgi:imidazolonepropionase-like amidohydrolase